MPFGRGELSVTTKEFQEWRVWAPRDLYNKLSCEAEERADAVVLKLDESVNWMTARFTFHLFLK